MHTHFLHSRPATVYSMHLANGDNDNDYTSYISVFMMFKDSYFLNVVHLGAFDS